tara:strand:- start:2864 stop:4072 length:1209 start_codon:yes stop_codon:yes gene_type:complete
MIFRKQFFLQLISISIGFTISFIVLEVFAFFAPATDIFPIVKPIECKDLNELDYKCFLRRKSFSKLIWSRGKFRPFNKVVIKNTNDIGQFTDIDMKKFRSSDQSNVKLVSIGDSYVEALQVKNSDTFHGILNSKYTNGGYKIISTAMGAGGMALPNYYAYLKFLKQSLAGQKIIFIIPIISNDFDESFLKYGHENQKHYRKGRGQFYFDTESYELIFIPYIEAEFNASERIVNFMLTNSRLARYLAINLELRQNISKLISIFFKDKKTDINQKMIFSKVKEDKEIYDLSNIAVQKFLLLLKELNHYNKDKMNIIFIVDSDRNSIYDYKSENQDLAFQAIRKEFIAIARDSNFKVIDTKEIFESDYRANKKHFESIYDYHWNEYAHKILSIHLLKEINKLYPK